MGEGGRATRLVRRGMLRKAKFFFQKGRRAFFQEKAKGRNRCRGEGGFYRQHLRHLKGLGIGKNLLTALF